MHPPFDSQPRHNRFRIGHSFMAIGALLFIALGLVFSSISTLPASAFGANEIFMMSNEKRREAGLDELTLHPDLIAAAQAKAEDMVTRDYFEHTAPDGTTGWGFITANNYIYTRAGENLAASNESEKSVVEGWMNSPSHRDNLLDGVFTDVGYGVAYKDRFRTYENVYFIVALYADPVDDPATIVAASTDGSPNTPSVETSAGSVSLSRSNPFVSPSLSFFVLGLSGALFASGLLIEAHRLRAHMAHARLHHHSSAR